MTDRQKIRVPAILGPTAVGKTELSLRLAAELKCEILSCDSRQVYRYMDIGTAKPSREEQKTVRHWMVDIINPSEPYSAHQFSQESLAIIRDTVHSPKTKLICGGTGLYFQSLHDGLGPQVASDPAFRKAYEKKASEDGKEALYEELQRCDPETAKRLHPNDVQRIIRALQVYYKTGTPLSTSYGKKRPPEDCEFLVIILMVPRDILYHRINKRVDNMIERGLWDEYCSIRKKGYTESDPGMQCVGYKELFSVEQGTWKLSEAREKIQRNSRNYAKRQITWFTNKTIGEHVDITHRGAYENIKEKIKRFLMM